MSDIIKSIKDLIAEKVGLKQALLDDALCHRILKARMQKTETHEAGLYFEKLKNSHSELQEFIDAVVNTETWFFRDTALFSFLVDHVKRMKEFKSVKERVDFLFIPCSSGEEPYTLLMALSDENINFSAVTIDAADISTKAIARAKSGLYGYNSFRGRDIRYRDKYFTHDRGMYRIDEKFKKHVTFFTRNVAIPVLPLPKQKYDVIVCRNMLMYLTPKAQKRAFDHFSRILAPEGILILAPAEGEIARKYGFVPNNYRENIIFFKKSPQKAVERLIDGDRQFFIPSYPSTIPSPEQSSLVIKDSALEEAKHCADLADYQKATDLCLNHLSRDHYSADAYFLLGVIQHAQGNADQAESFFQKTVYLNPKHYEALIYLSLLSENKNERRQAELFRERANRCKS